MDLRLSRQSGGWLLKSATWQSACPDDAFRRVAGAICTREARERAMLIEGKTAAQIAEEAAKMARDGRAAKRLYQPVDNWSAMIDIQPYG